MNTKSEIIIALAEICGEGLTESRLKAYLYTLRELTLKDLLKAFEAFSRDPNFSRFPLPGQILEKANPSLGSDDLAKEAASRIIGAISKFGCYGGSEAKAYIGEVGWEVVKMQGGWVTLCQQMQNNMIPTMTAQFRELAKAIIKKAELGINDAPALPKPENKQLENNKDKLKIIVGKINNYGL